MSFRWRALCLILLAHCGGDDGSDPNGDIDAGGPPEWQTLVSGEWTIAAQTEDYLCVRKTVDRDMYIGGFRALAPNGTHHTVLTVGAKSGSDGVESCNSFQNHLSLVYGSGVGTSEYTMPEGVAVKVSAGQQLLLNLHLFNVGETDLSGISGTEVLEVPAADVVHEAEAVLMGPVQFSIPPGNQVVTGSCTPNVSATIFGVFPHMHYLGTHMKVDVAATGATTNLHDGPYDFEDQQIYPVTPTAIDVGDVVEVTCSYTNATDQTVSFGESSEAEMCFAAVFYYPAQGKPYICSDDL